MTLTLSIIIDIWTYDMNYGLRLMRKAYMVSMRYYNCVSLYLMQEVEVDTIFFLLHSSVSHHVIPIFLYLAQLVA